MNIVEYIEALDNVNILGPSSDEEIMKAENELGLKFAKDFRDYLKKFRYFSHKDLELLGLVDNKAFNVVDVTLRNREVFELKANYYVISELGMDSILILQDEAGNIYEWYPGSNPEKIFQNLLEYIQSYS